ncbi:MAG: hypothetical protein FJ306_13865 [Planctomycetes bacterium]|nr:hypothetical protein [Planctomycetota bacterium]
MPQSRDALWSFVSGRLHAIQPGLTLVFDGFDCADGELGAIEGLARDADGAPVLVLLARDGDPLLAQRALAAAAFLERVGDGLALAIPEGGFRSGLTGRALVVAVAGAAAALRPLVRQTSASLQVCALEPFRVAGKERFAVRWLDDGARAPATAPFATETGAAESIAAEMGAAAAAVTAAPAAGPTPAHVQALWSRLEELCLRIDQGIRIDAADDRRRITWNGQTLAEVRADANALRGTLPDGSECALSAPADVGAFSNRLLRGYSRLAGLVFAKRSAAGGDEDAAALRAPAARTGLDGLRAAAAAAQLTQQEHSALGAPTSAVGDAAERAAMTSDLARIAAAQGKGSGANGGVD